MHHALLGEPFGAGDVDAELSVEYSLRGKVRW